MLSAPAGGNTTYGSVRGIRTSASSVYGGVTSGETLAKISTIKFSTPPIPGLCEECHWVQDEHGHWYCDVCGCDAMDGCDCEDKYGQCWCPIELDWKVFLFFSALAGAYALYKVRASKKKSEAC